MMRNIKGALSNYFHDGAALFVNLLYPAPSVGYSKVTVTDLGPDLATGYTVNEFYTAKDYPVRVNYLPIQRSPTEQKNSYSLVKTNSVNKQCLAQGYVIELNDMHGKAKANRVFNQSGAEISSTVYYYNGEQGALDNNVNVINPVDLKMSTKVLGRDLEFYTDFREQESTNQGTAINVGADVFPIFFFPFFALPHNPKAENNDYKLFRSASALKVVQNYGILNRVIKTQNGSSITTQNIAFDELTGEPLITKTQNEFKKDLFSVNIPAYWAYKGMGAAYQNMGMLLKDLATNSSGEIQNYTSFLQAGDEIVDLSHNGHFWVIENTAANGTGTSKKLIDQDGLLNKGMLPGLVKVVRSGYRNMLNDKITTLVCLNNPVSTTGYLQLNTAGDLTAMKLINASASTYDENWAEEDNTSFTKRIPFVLQGENTDYDYTFQAGTRTADKAWFFTVGEGLTPISNKFWGSSVSVGGRMSASSIWPTTFGNHTVTDSDYVGFHICFYVPQSKTYYFGSGSNLEHCINFDYNQQSPGCFGMGSLGWIIEPIYFEKGYHTLHFRFMLGFTNSTYGLGAGIEIYDNTKEELMTTDDNGTGVNIVFSTGSLRGVSNLSSYWLGAYKYGQGYGPLYEHYQNQDPYKLCGLEVPANLNPYTSGYLGNWRPYQTKVFQGSRNYSFTGNLNKTGVNVKDAGYLNSFRSYWTTNAGVWAANTTTTKWVNANTVTLYDKYGQQLENKDALNRYSAAKFDFNGELPSVVASNAKNRDIYYGSFEDSKFTVGQVANPQTDVRDFRNAVSGVTAKETADKTLSHSGNYCVPLPAQGLKLSTVVHSREHKTEPYLELDADKQYRTRDSVNIYPNGFQPTGGKKYIFNAWVKDASPGDKTVNLGLIANGANIPLTCKAVVEGWKLVEGTMDLTQKLNGAMDITITPNAGQSLYIDDIRIHPFDAHMKSYAYDDKTMRLMAELDENAFATFYEYDDEGLLIRVKKETERGIMTIKETRSGYKKGSL